MLAYYSATAAADFWTEHWGGHDVVELLAVARASPLTDLITRALPREGLVLEAGCGLGQYVILLRERGWRAAGVDASVPALAACRRVVPVPLAASDLRALAVRDGALAAYVSLGVVEHDPDGPDAILAEARRVLAPGGVLLASVPYVNGVRRLGARAIRRRQAAIRAAGGAFYQYAFSRREFLAALRRQGFEPVAAHPYDPARLLRGAARRAAALARGRPARPAAGDGRPPARAAVPTPPASSVASATTERREAGAGPATAGGEEQGRSAGAAAPGAGARGGSRGWLARAARRALYTEPALRLLGHMLLVVARRA